MGMALRDWQHLFFGCPLESMIDVVQCTHATLLIPARQINSSVYILVFLVIFPSFLHKSFTTFLSLLPVYMLAVKLHLAANLF